MKREVFLSPEFSDWAADPFVAVSGLEGEVFRHVKTRRTFRFERNGRGYFAKVHHGVGWREIFKNYSQGKRPVLGAMNEFRALNFLKKLGVDTMTPCAYGAQGENPAKIESFLVTAELVGMVSLEDLCRPWAKQPPPHREKCALSAQLARSAGTMHRAGLNHRDCYLCHFLLDPPTLAAGAPRLYVIDLHRAEIRERVPYRYLVKDVAGLWFSAMDIGLTRRDLLRFIRRYAARSLREEWRANAGFWRDVDRVARKLYQKEFQRESTAVSL